MILIRNDGLIGTAFCLLIEALSGDYACVHVVQQTDCLGDGGEQGHQETELDKI